MNIIELLKACEQAFNEIPNKSLRTKNSMGEQVNSGFKSTYDIATAISKQSNEGITAIEHAVRFMSNGFHFSQSSKEEVTEIRNKLKRIFSLKDIEDEKTFIEDQYKPVDTLLIEALNERKVEVDLLFDTLDEKFNSGIEAASKGIRPTDKKVFDCSVPLSGDGAYDKGGAYWGIGKQLRVSYTKDLSYVEFYRVGEQS